MNPQKFLSLGVGSGKEAGEDNNYGSSSFLFYLAWVDEHSAQEHPLNPCQIHMPGTKKCSAEGQVRTLNLGKLSGLMESALSVCCFSLIYNLSITLQEELLLRHLRKFRSQSKDFSIIQMQVDGLKVFFIFFYFLMPRALLIHLTTVFKDLLHSLIHFLKQFLNSFIT